MTEPSNPAAFFASTRVLEPEQIAMQAGQRVPFLRLPQRATVFADRGLRLRQLAAGHPMRDYLLFVADIAQAQHEALQHHPDVKLPDLAAIEAASQALRPPLPADLWPRDPAWRAVLRQVLGPLRDRLPEGPARETVQRVLDADSDWLERQAGLITQGIMFGLDLGTAPLVAAGLQVYFTHMAIATAEEHGALRAFGVTEPLTRCPCCGSAPTAGVIRIGADDAGVRYLHCALCSTQWHYVRIKCANCESTKGIHYQSLEPEGEAAPERPVGLKPGAVRAECCDECGHYLKLVAMDRDPEVEAVADDLASLPLDLLVSEAGHQRTGHNLMLLFGDPEPEAASANHPPDDGGGG
ncbi:formate dehydrogenase accessory protein FdhE [uncultured Pseudacidovorax sp.]|uniref:formate dehydrogenase accessory protein FdhE n=1 Tax=uncultured Pseudacidovorax sp. TaxID=679313 RepID=UPI0025D54A29|nr:formate dehydrogenase accessory protein FdhE [uncultured Pseudacidovorax sp.]